LIYFTLIDADLIQDGVAFNQARLAAMEFANQIDGAPKNGDFIILQDASSREVGRWAREANGWVQPDGTPVRISPTHWTRVSDDFAGPTDRERSLFLTALAAPLPNDETEQTQKRPLTPLILALVTAIFCISGFVFWIGSKDSSSDNWATDLEREFSRGRERASVAIGGLTAAREREDVALTEALESTQIANSKQRESKRALDESEAKSEALARELASARENDVAARNLAAAREREIAAQALETKQIADARQKEFKQALDESEKRALALKRELTSARETNASAEKPFNAEVTARDAATPTGPLNRPMEQSNAAPEIMTTPQSRGNVTAGVQASSDTTPDDATAGASGRLTRSTRSEPSRRQPPSAMSSAEEAKLVARAESLIKQFDFVGARLLLVHALEKGSARAAFMMAETYDRQILRSLHAYGVRGDAQMAREFYQLAAAAGIEKARERVEALQSDANAGTRVGDEKHSR
jgi:hypothetical protein